MNKNDYVDFSAPVSSTLTAMQATQSARLEGYEVQVLDNWFPITDLKSRAIVGSFSINDLDHKRKFIKRAYVRNIGCYNPCTPGDIARDYLRVKFPDRKVKMTGRQWKAVYEIRRSHPLYAQPCDIEHGFYIDIRAAYWTLLQIFGWDVDYCPMRFLGVRSDVEDFPFPDDKLARNMLVSSGLLSPLKVWTGSEVSSKKAYNQYINYSLWAAVQDTLNAVASECVDAGAVYAFSDGYIAPASRAGEVMSVIESWGLPCRVKAEGKTTVKAAASYKIGTTQTSRYNTARENPIRKISEHVKPAWLKKRIVAFSDYRKRLGFME